MANGARSLYLLTTSAESFFESLGFAPANRIETPFAIRGTKKFAGLCPSTARLMVKRVAA
jgi:amino-acid N-acetyltransferase